MSALEITLVILLGLGLVVLIAIALQLQRTLLRSLDLTDSIHKRQQDHLDRAIDRLMAVDWAEYKAWTREDQSERREEDFVIPTPEEYKSYWPSPEEGEEEENDRFGLGTDVGLSRGL